MNNLISNKPSMTHKEIAEMVGSRIDSVQRTIERLADRGVIQLPPLVDFEEINNLGLEVTREYYNFEGDQGKRDSIVVVAQLCPEFTASLVDRWRELEDERCRPKSQAELIAAMAMANLEQERRLNHVEDRVVAVTETIEKIKRGSIPVGWAGYSLLKTKSGMTVPKCKNLVNACRIPTDTITIMTPDGQPRPMAIVLEADFMAAFRKMMSEAEPRGTRWYHPKMGIFQAIGWAGAA
ncbi:TPA: Rha family transcriptional regulator [Yersinia enterocolitica]|uniref:helix-turn-helix domain-containing protein n=1 Tax=Yersinia enterocolitica TaxID=630 RepID=UPI002AC7A7AE|nr:Rha family transcriptional regulator [Yersinia enterocolitica]HDQ4038713.1 Rha family transcriptional regulator [Yersinia enterocolitica]HEN3242985.1 Rha family transcriptional regulator [Yersinia enterocolitica]HEN3265397.1 Rha family transcriptional regulator [Yersinia enterocolitica]HEN3320528.1 Rha family transcriptional regulator [Yersinia enterocolitica]